jgi:hypothetical protein
MVRSAIILFLVRLHQPAADIQVTPLAARVDRAAAAAVAAVVHLRI